MRAERDPPRATSTLAPRRALILTLLFAMVPPGCASLRPLPPGGLSLVVLKSDWHDLRLGNKAAPALSILRSVSLADPLVRAEPADVEEYRWSTETLVLTSSATSRVVDTLSRTATRQEGIDKLNRLKERLGDDNVLAHALYVQPFVVLLAEDRGYGGIFLDGESQMAIDFPVARVRDENKRAVLHFLPVHLPFYETDPAVDPTAGDDRPGDVPTSMLDHFRKAAMTETRRGDPQAPPGPADPHLARRSREAKVARGRWGARRGDATPSATTPESHWRPRVKALGVDRYRNIVILTGAGVSVASGLRPYRGPGGLWEEASVAQLATPSALADRPDEVWRLFGTLRAQARAARPNAAHHAIAELEQQLGPDVVTVMTQNVDGLHQCAGSSNVVELHGTVFRTRCSSSSCDLAAFDDEEARGAGAAVPPVRRRRAA